VTNSADDLLEFLAKSPTPFHATATLADLLLAQGFSQLSEHDSWSLKPGRRYFCVRGQSALIAFIYGEKPLLETGIHLIGAHTDSPCLKVKPQPEKLREGYLQLGVDVYGGALLNPWFDRDLSIAGRVDYTDEKGLLKQALIDFAVPIAVIPSLAIHLDREANSGRAVNPQTQMSAIIGQSDKAQSWRETLLLQLQLQDPSAIEILDYNLSFYDVQPPSLVGLQREFVASARLDNLLSCYLGAAALVKAGSGETSLLICNDHEEIGSRTELGAQGPLLNDVLQRILPDADTRLRVLRKSMMLSVDNAHGIHPNFADKHDSNHGPRLNAGPVLKFDANQSYATNSSSAAKLRYLAKGEGGTEEIPLQSFVMRADMRCGSTIGPITAALTGVETVDLGVPTFAMHSIRELAGSKDITHLELLLSRFLASPLV
jgi:Aspartyl aminopeptidase